MVDRPSDGDQGVLRALLPIESLGETAPFEIVPLRQTHGTSMPAAEVMRAKVRWARKAGYRVLTRTVPERFYPYNAVIRINEAGTEDYNRDYLAQISG